MVAVVTLAGGENGVVTTTTGVGVVHLVVLVVVQGVVGVVQGVVGVVVQTVTEMVVVFLTVLVQSVQVVCAAQRPLLQ